MKRIGLLICFCGSLFSLYGLDYQPETLKQAEELLKAQFSRMAGERDDARKQIIADSITGMLNYTLQLPGAFDYPFDLLNALGKVKSKDQRIRIFTWNLPFSNGTHTYYGFLLVRNDSDNPPQVFRLTDKSDDIPDPARIALTPDNWMGCLVYDIVEKNYSGETYYTLLGYDPHNLFVSRKIIDLLWFNMQREPVFGKAIFHYQKQMQQRIIFEYSAKVSMTVQWNDKLNMIIFDHLSPSKPSFTGNYQYYGPDFSYDGLRFEKGIWEMAEDIDVRNSNK